VKAWGLRARLLLSILALLVFTGLGAWGVTSGGVLKRLVGGVLEERVEVAAYIAREVRLADDREARAAELAEALGVQIEVSEDRPKPGSTWSRRIRAGHLRAWVERGPSTPIHVPLGRRGDPEAGFLTVRFPSDLDRPTRLVALGLAVLVLLAALGAWVMSRWVVRPLEYTTVAMGRVEAGELSHRLPEGADLTGQIGRAFNAMAGRVEGLVTGQRRLLAAVSHELRTPLTRMRLQLEMLRQEGAAEERLASLERQIGEVDSLIGELVESSRLSEGVLALRAEEVDVRALFEEALALVDLGERPVALAVPDGLSLSADRRRLLRVCTNLLSNIGRYTPATASVWLAARPDADDTVRIEVSDDGPGVPDAVLPELFTPFFRVEASRSKATGGLGLGMMLVRQIVVAHGGAVGAEARPGGGLRVWLCLPAQLKVA